MWWPNGRNGRICPECLRNGSIGETCPDCNATTINLPACNVPKKKAKAKVWREFAKEHGLPLLVSGVRVCPLPPPIKHMNYYDYEPPTEEQLYYDHIPNGKRFRKGPRTLKSVTVYGLAGIGDKQFTVEDMQCPNKAVAVLITGDALHFAVTHLKWWIISADGKVRKKFYRSPKLTESDQRLINRMVGNYLEGIDEDATK